MQLRLPEGDRKVGVVDSDKDTLSLLNTVTSVYELATKADEEGLSIRECLDQFAGDNQVDYGDAYRQGMLLPPIDHPDPAHCLVSGTGLNHLGSAQARHAMHEEADDDPKSSQIPKNHEKTDSMRMFEWGMKGGKPQPGKVGVQPEWFFRGTGDTVVGPGDPLNVPSYALDGGEEAELVEVYLISGASRVLRVGFTLGNEFSDHVMEKQNYLYLAHSKLRMCSMGPELILGEIPDHVEGYVRVFRGNPEVWSSPFASGEANMSHSLANLAHHHFKYGFNRRPGDVHCHFLGASVLSFSSGLRLQDGDRVEISSPAFTKPLVNSVHVDQRPEQLVEVTTL